MVFARLRRSVAAFIYPEMLRDERQKKDEGDDQKVGVDQNIISALLTLTNAFQAQTAVSDWEVAGRAGVNNRAIMILRRGSVVAPRTAARLFEYFEESWPVSLAWPLDAAVTALFGTILTIPVIEKVGGPDAMLDLIRQSGRKRTKGAVASWASRSGMPDYARTLASNECQRSGIAVSADDFDPTRLTPAQIDALRHIARAPKSKKEAA